MMKNSKLTLSLLVVLVLLIGIVSGTVYIKIQKNILENEQAKINSFNDCIKAGYPVLESYPRQCRLPRGKTFIEELSNEEKDKLVLPQQTNCQNLCGDGTCQEIVCLSVDCPCAETEESCPIDCAAKDNSTSIANPASVNCEKIGGKLEIKNDEQGNQTGYCLFPDGQECEEWALFRNECALSPSSQMGVLEGKVTIGPICPVERVGEPCQVPATAYTLREIIIYKSDAKTEVSRQNFSENGTYRFELPPGVYIVDTVHSGIVGSKDLPQPVIIKSGETLTLNFNIDTGIR